MNNTGIILTLAYPETIVKVSDEWFAPYLWYVGIGKKNYVRAGHAAVVLIEKATGNLSYHDFGRYVTPFAHGRVRGKDTDHELDFPLHAEFENREIKNLNDILIFLATHPKLTHGEGKMIASVCDEIDFEKAQSYIKKMESRDFIRYAVFKNEATNCSRFVTQTLIASVNNEQIKNRLIRSTRFTPSTVGNVIIADNKNKIYEISEEGKFHDFSSSIRRENIRCFLDRLKVHKPNDIGTLHPKTVEGVSSHAQWLGGTGAGAWFELYTTETRHLYRYKRISAYGNIDVNGIYMLEDLSFNYNDDYIFVHYSNCKFFHIKQGEKIYRFDLTKKLS
ncbi:MAG: hypothetical protein HKN54_01265 [Flavobacteriaceae bacterium]|nr:hypothetical protein [Flavobacteriaceae bacterium]